MKKRLIKIIIASILLTVIIFFFLKCTGYKMPQEDIHKDWSTIDKNTNKNYIVKASIKGINVILKMGQLNRYLVYGDTKSIIDSTGKILFSFKDTEKVLIDKNNNQLIIEPNYVSYDSTNVFSYIFNPETFAKKRIKLFQYSNNNSYQTFLDKQNIKLDIYDKEYKLKDSIYTQKYRNENANEINFLNSLFPVVEWDESLRWFHVIYYIDKAGKLYHFNNSQIDYDDFNQSLEKLWKKWDETPLLTSAVKGNPNFFVADTDIITNNELNFDSGFRYDPKGGGSQPMSFYYEQGYLNYYGIKFNKQIFNFKIYNNKNVGYSDLDSFTQLNYPKSESDTLAFLYKEDLYQIYKRK